MAKIGIGLDIGSTAAKLAAGRMEKGAFIPLKAAVIPRPPAGWRAGDLAEALGRLRLRGGAMLGLSGRDMIIRYTQVTPMSDWQLKQVMEFEIEDLSLQSGGDLSADYNRLAVPSSLSEDDAILLTLVKNTLLEERLSLLKGGRVAAEAFTPNAIALFNLASRTADLATGTTLLLDVGAEAVDLAVAQEGSLVFARNLAGGSALFNQALEERFKLTSAQAEKVKRELGCLLPAAESGGTLSPQQEKVGRSLSEAAGRIFSMIQSSLMFCKSQIKVAELTLDRAYLTGGGARLKGFDRALSQNLGVPVHLLDPALELDITRMDDPSAFVEGGLELSCAMGLAVMSATPEHYAIHVLPEAAKKRRRFQTRTLFGILAAVLLLAFLGLDFYLSRGESLILERDRRAMAEELKKREQWTSELETLSEENGRLAEALNRIDEEIIPTYGLVQTLALIQEYLPDEFWITSVEIRQEAREELGQSRKQPMILVKGSGREMGQSLQQSFTVFRQRLDEDPRTRGLVPQVRYGEDFSFSFLIQFTRMDGAREATAGGEEDRADAPAPDEPAGGAESVQLGIPEGG